MIVTDMNSTNSFVIGSDDSKYIGSDLWVAVFSVIILVIISGNCLTIFAIIFNRHLRAVISNRFISSLAVSDLLVGITTPYHVFYYLFEDFGESKTACIVRFILMTFASTGSVCKLLLVAADRYIAIVYPLHYIKYMTQKCSMLLISLSWILALIVATIPIYWNNWKVGTTCETEIILPHKFLLCVLTPMFTTVWFTLLLIYIKIWREAHHHAKRLETMESKKIGRGDTKSILVVMLTLGCFSICWMPFFIVTTYYRISNSSSKFSLWYEIAFTMAVANSGMNPIIYAWKNSNFREAFKCVLTCRSPDKLKKQSYITNHVPSKKGKPANSETQGHDNVVATIETDDESRPQAQYDECSVATEMSNVATLPRTHS